MKLVVAKVEYVLIDNNLKDKVTGQPQRSTGSKICAGEGPGGVLASLMEELQPQEHGFSVEVSRVDTIRDHVIFHPQELAIPPKDLRAAREAARAVKA